MKQDYDNLFYISVFFFILIYITIRFPPIFIILVSIIFLLFSFSLFFSFNPFFLAVRVLEFVYIAKYTHQESGWLLITEELTKGSGSSR